VDPLALVLAPWRATRAIVRAADDLHVLAERARQEPDPVDEVRELLQELLGNLHALNRTADTIVTGGDDLRRTGEKLDGHMLELIDGGADLTETAKTIDGHLAIFAAALPRLMATLDTVEDLEDAVGTVADTVEPLQGITNGVGKVRRRLSPSSD
jgi:hypothetical protein